MSAVFFNARTTPVEETEAIAGSLLDQCAESAATASPEALDSWTVNWTLMHRAMLACDGTIDAVKTSFGEVASLHAPTLSMSKATAQNPVREAMSIVPHLAVAVPNRHQAKRR